MGIISSWKISRGSPRRVISPSTAETCVEAGVGECWDEICGLEAWESTIKRQKRTKKMEEEEEEEEEEEVAIFGRERGERKGRRKEGEK